MKSLDNKLIIYDSNCKVCSSLRDVVVRFTSIPEAKIKAHKDLDPRLSQHVDAATFRNVMALIDTSGGQTVYGAEGLAYIFSSQYRLVDYLFRFPFMLKLFTFFYKTQAYNRYIIATPKSKFQCDCFPDRIVKYRINYIVLTLLIAVLLTAIFGIALRNFAGGISPSAAAWQMILMAGTGWVVQMALALVVLRNKALDYIGHLGSIMVAGLLILLPWILFHAITAIENIYLPLMSVVISSAVMLCLHIHRVRHLELSQAWTVSWFLLLQSGAIFWIWFFYLN
ncbi:hypothetical protein KK083_03590 [Fulvivirgaceae bacterium PWU4]|uniref:DUF393 domain-containing protein n=1 Tax=Chryseosolibacter histidini TaxID=2782349 RepID=A0AAP2DHZ7_9BACT|nr:hypothetical protein [Chryseosolibacter histidini]MBT1695944.1 hypothetical protein [Chryseosolibacter histidini]